MHHNHELRVWAEQGPLHDGRSEGESCPVLEQSKESFQLIEERFNLFQWESQSQNLKLAELFQEAI